MDTRRIAVALGALVIFQAGLLLGRVVPADALAQDDPAPATTRRLVCKTFAFEPGGAGAIETADRTTEIGQWVAAREAEGWELYGVDFEMGTKATGYPQGWLQVCVQPL